MKLEYGEWIIFEDIFTDAEGREMNCLVMRQKEGRFELRATEPSRGWIVVKTPNGFKEIYPDYVSDLMDSHFCWPPPPFSEDCNNDSLSETVKQEGNE